MTSYSQRILRASEAALQPLPPQYISLNYGNLFKIQRVRNPFPLRPVSFSALSFYLECPHCAYPLLRKRRAKEPFHFTNIHQGKMFGTGKPDPRLVGTLLHTIINVLHDPNKLISPEKQQSLLTEPRALTHFLLHDLITVLRSQGRNKMAMFVDEMLSHKETLQHRLIHPMLRYQHELLSTRSHVFSTSERFCFKLLSTRNTFVGHSDWGGVVGIVGEFDQIRLRFTDNSTEQTGTPAIFEFKAGLGRQKSWDKSQPQELEIFATPAEDLTEPGLAHAFQLMVYWLAFQICWDQSPFLSEVRGNCIEIPMSLDQQLDLILYDLSTSTQYKLHLKNAREGFRAMINCIFHIDWAMKSGYTQPMPDHQCSKTALYNPVPEQPVRVGYDTLAASDCFQYAREALYRFKEQVTWHKLGTQTRSTGTSSRSKRSTAK